MQLSGHKVLITGGGSGIGLAIAKAFLDAGSKVTVTGRKEDKLQKACADNPGLEYAVCDVTNDEQIKALVSKLDQDGGINILVNNAGVFTEFNYRDDSASLDEQIREVDIDFNGPIRMTHYFLPMLKKQSNATLVNVSSGLAFVPLTLAPVYCGTKAAIHSWTRSLRFQLQGNGIKVFELMPPLVATEMTTDYSEHNPISTEELVDSFVKGFTKDNYEITPGQASQLRMMSRLAPGFIFNAVNKQFAG